MFLTITSIILAVLLGMTFACAWRFSNSNQQLRWRIKGLNKINTNLEAENGILKKSLDRACCAMTADNATYFSSVCSNELHWCVMRRSFVDGFEFHTLVKIFNDSDSDFNRREAEELCDILNH